MATERVNVTSVCPECKGKLRMDSMTTLACLSCGARYRVTDDGELEAVNEDE